MKIYNSMHKKQLFSVSYFITDYNEASDLIIQKAKFGEFLKKKI